MKSIVVGCINDMPSPWNIHEEWNNVSSENNTGDTGHPIVYRPIHEEGNKYWQIAAGEGIELFLIRELLIKHTPYITTPPSEVLLMKVAAGPDSDWM